MGNFAAVIASDAFSSGTMEGLNSKARVTIRKACSFRTFKMEKRSLNHVLRKLPEPILTHRFCGTARFSLLVRETGIHAIAPRLVVADIRNTVLAGGVIDFGASLDFLEVIRRLDFWE